jgi:hypothetical protein
MILKKASEDIERITGDCKLPFKKLIHNKTIGIGNKNIFFAFDFMTRNIEIGNIKPIRAPL